ncbi:unnamed protein product [Parnassius apollo]|uniref:(apollo) hypothetical protein n=1 Tax=Parnassius apollo TaxID=110799 RepID=A0A8S3WPC7_PARAO|nr:unnamed protein product [Parnassius apollo]
MTGTGSSDSDGPLIDDNIIRIQLRKPSHRKWELRTRNLSPDIRFPIIQLFDYEGNLLVETNEENISIKSCDYDKSQIRASQSFGGKGYKHIIHRKLIRKHHTISGDKVYTRIYKPTVENEKNKIAYIVENSNSICNIPNELAINYNFSNSLQPSSVETTPLHSEISSYKSSDNETCEDEEQVFIARTELNNDIEDKVNDNKFSAAKNSENEIVFSEVNKSNYSLNRSQSFSDTALRDQIRKCTDYLIPRSSSGANIYNFPRNKVSFLNTYLRSIAVRRGLNANCSVLSESKKFLQNSESDKKIDKEVKDEKTSKIHLINTDRINGNKREENISENEFIYNLPMDIAAHCELKKRIQIYRRGLSEIGQREIKLCRPIRNRRNSISGPIHVTQSSSSESVDEADVVLNRLKRRIFKNKSRERRRSHGSKQDLSQNQCGRVSDSKSTDWQDDDGGAYVRSRHAMGSNISQHSSKGLKGRRARSSGDLCNGDSKSQTESSVCGSVVGDVMGWNRSLPNHLDGNRHLADYSRVNNSYGELGTYNRCQKGARGLRYRVSNSGSEAEPVWKLQESQFDQGYGSERSPEEDYVAPIAPAVSLEEYEAELRNVYTFITDENTFTVVVEKDGRGLGMSVCGGGGLVRIRRLYPPQPAWRTGLLAPRDLLLSANGVPLAGLSTYEALEVLRTASTRVELRVCRPPSDALESITPPDPPTPPARTPHPPHLPPLDPLNCHPLHARLSQTTSSATTSSSEGRGRREASPETDRRDLHLPDLDRPLPVYDIEYGEFDIVMTKVNGSLGFTLRKEDHSALGHYVRALVREPALSDGRIQPGDRIVAVNDTPMSNMSHTEAVAFLRACGSEVRLRLYRDHAATPLSPMSPKDEGPTDSDLPLNRPKPPLRAEAVSMLCDLAARRLTPDTTDGTRSPCLSPRKFRKLTKDTNHYEHPTDAPSFDIKLETHTKVNSETVDGSEHERHTDTGFRPTAQKSRRSQRQHTVSLASPTSPPTRRKQKLSLTVPPHGYELNNLDNDTLDAPNVYQEDTTKQRYSESVFPVDSDEPVSMPAELSSDEARFKHSNPTYQSAVLHTSSSEATSDGHKDDGNGLKKWKGVALSPDNERKMKPEAQPKPKEVEAVQKENIQPDPPVEYVDNEPTIVSVELNRGWNSRLGFSVQSHPESGQSYVSAVHRHSVAARDGRLRAGDVILQVNDENVTSMKTPEVIDLLRILRGSICITVLRPPNSQ